MSPQWTVTVFFSRSDLIRSNWPVNIFPTISKFHLNLSRMKRCTKMPLTSLKQTRVFTSRFVVLLGSLGGSALRTCHR